MGLFETVRKFWKGWELRALVSLSLTLQVILIAFGSKRKTATSKWIKFLVWSSYMSADWVATIALGILARSVGIKRNPIQLFWAPFLLLHLGGPDNITAYSLEDNELWQRHFLGLVFQIGVAVYVLLWSWVDGKTALNSIAIPVLIAGIIKYGERNYVLMSSSRERFRASILKKGRYGSTLRDDLTFLQQVKFFFIILEYLSAELILPQWEARNCNRIIRRLERREAFKVVEFELGLLYDLLFTKARLVYSRLGMFLRFITCLASVSALVSFSIIINEHEYSPVDISFTYLLLVGAVVLEVYSLLMIVFSDWTKLWLDGWRLAGLVDQIIRFSLKGVTKEKRWSRSIPRFNLVKFCIKKKKTMQQSIAQKLFGSNEISEKQQNVEWRHGIVEDLEILIFKHLDAIVIESAEICDKVLNSRGNWVLQEMNCTDEFIRRSTIDVELDESILVWHIATQLCYYDDIRKSLDHLINDYSKISRCLSEYMLYLLVLCPNMLPKGFGYIKFKRVCVELIGLLSRDMKMEGACQMLLEYRIENYTSQGPSDFGILSKGCRLAKDLQNLKPRNQDNWGSEKKWEMMNKVWVEILTYTAGHCGWKEHAQQLPKGGQLLTQVCLLMAHFGVSEQFKDLSPEHFNYFPI